MRNPDRLTIFLLEMLAPLGPVAARRMFGGIGLFHQGMMFGLIAREELFLKVGDSNRHTYEAAGETPFSYQTSQGTHTIQSYWRCPPDLLDDAEALQAWARQAVGAALVAAQAKPGRAKPGKARSPKVPVGAPKPESSGQAPGPSSHPGPANAAQPSGRPSRPMPAVRRAAAAKAKRPR